MSQVKNQLEDLRPGEIALVRCVKVERYSYRYGDRCFVSIPILPYPPHTDADIVGFAPSHYHFDYRFWSIELIEDFLEDDITLDPEDWPATILLESEVIGEFFELELVCEREPTIAGAWFDFVQKLEDHFQDCVLLPGNICPHKGYKVHKSPLIVDRFSKQKQCAYGCPGHGLSFDQNKRVQRRTKPTKQNVYHTGELED